MKAVILEGINQPFICKELPVPEIAPHEVLVNIKAAALNHRDVWIQKGQYAGLRFPSIQGSDGAGVVVKVGEAVSQDWIGKEVVINPSLNWGNNPDTQAKNYIILGMAQDGTFAEYVKIDASLIHPKPTHLTMQQAAALPLAGLTGYRALVTRAKAKAGHTVLITGVGGGVAMFCFQFALALGCDVFVTSGSDDKIEKAVQMGAKGGVNYKQAGWHKELIQQSVGFDAIVDSACGEQFSLLVDMCKPAGHIAFYGATLGAFNSGVPAKIFWKQLTICGSTMGNNQEFEQMLALVNSKKIIPQVDQVFELAQTAEAAAYLESGKQFGKVVIQVS